MIKFTRDLSDPQVLDLVVSKTAGRKYARLLRQFVETEMVLLTLFTAYLWLFSRRFSLIYPLGILFLLGLASGYQKFQARKIREKILYMDAQEIRKPEYRVDQNGVHVHTAHSDTEMYWSHFISWGIRDRVLYLQTNDHRWILCHQRQLSQEDFQQFKALAAAQIGTQEEGGAR